MRLPTVAITIMPYPSRIRRAMLLIAALFSLCPVSAQDNEALSLFDGKTLAGWDFDPQMWRVKDGLITGGSTTDKIPRNTFISTQKSFHNFELKLTIKCSGDPKTGLINSGIQIRSTRVPGGDHVAGYQVDCGKDWFGKIYDEFRRRTPIAIQVDAAALDKAVDIYGWNDYRILAEGPRIRVWINDVLATDYTETNPNIALDGIIAPQVHSGGVALVQVKDITIRELPATPGAPTWESLGGLKEALKLAPPAKRKPRPKNPRTTKEPKNASNSLPPLPKGEGRINFNFESGDLQGWYIAEGWFAHPIANNKLTRNSQQPLHKEGEYYLGTLEDRADGPPNDRQTGILESPVFQLTGPDIQFALSGGSHDNTYLALCTLDGKEVKKASAQNSEVFAPQSWQAPELVGKSVFLRLVDQRETGWGHIVLDAFSTQGKLLPDETKKRKATAKPQKPSAQAIAKKARPRKKTQSARTKAQSAAEQLAGFTVPPGFVIELVASEEHGVINPIDLSFDDQGRLWTQTAQMYPLDPISGIKWNEILRLMDDQKTQQEHPDFQRVKALYQLKTKGEDKILILDDPTQPATEPLHVWADGLSIPQSILPYKDGAYVCHGSELFLLRDTDGDDKSDKMEPVLTGFGFIDTHTMSHLLVRGPGSYIHFTQGALNKGTVTAVASGKQAEVNASCQVRFPLDHQDLEVLSSGPSNMWGLQLRANGEWYGTEANDRAYSIIPWEHGTAVTGAAFHPMRSYQPLLPNLHKFRVGGTGISGLEFSDDTAGSFPVDEWKDVALLGNGITSTINAVRVHRNPDGTVEAEHLPDFLTSEDDWFRPVNLEFGPDGCLYVADFYNKIISHNEVSTGHPDRDRTHGRIWRIRHESQLPRAIPDVTQATPEQLLTHLQAPSLWEKRAAWQQIGDRALQELAPALIKMVADEKVDTVTRIHALWSLEELRQFDSQLLDSLLSSTNDDLRREAVRSLASFELSPAEVASRLTGHLEDPNVMVRSQTIRTLSDLKTSDPAVLALLIEACKPALEGNALGGSYERNFERFLARMALEKFPAELKSYLDTSASNHPAANILWAIQALDAKDKNAAFLRIWEQASGETLDSETFVAITSMLGDKEVDAALQPTFQDLTKAQNLVSLSLANQSRVQSPQLFKMLTPTVAHLLKSPETQALGLSAVGKFRIASLSEQVSGIKSNSDNLRLLLSAQAVNPEKNASNFQALATDEANPLDLRIDAALALAPVNEAESLRLAQALATTDDATQKSQLTSQFSQSPVGAQLLARLAASGELTPTDFDLSSAERMIQADPNNPQAKKIITAARQQVAQQRKQAQARIHDLMAKITANPGDPAKGKLTFASCLTCHQVGTEGQDIAPPLDGSGHRDLEHLLTAIVDPDAAVEGGYGLYRITKTDGSVVEGLLDKEEALGTTIALMGGGRVFVPQAEIKKAAFVGGRSFMPALFGQLPDDTIADLVAYISTLKEEKK
ncbi:MAG: PVC-type heme-binding CxxCH protein [Roseibacillus sp.]